jgi:hypothetical protein
MGVWSLSLLPSAIRLAEDIRFWEKEIPESDTQGIQLNSSLILCHIISAFRFSAAMARHLVIPSR